MAEIVAHPIPFRRTRLLRLRKLSIGSALLAMAKAVGKAFEMAYVAPYETKARQSHPGGRADLQGRDPSW